MRYSILSPLIILYLLASSCTPSFTVKRFKSYKYCNNLYNTFINQAKCDSTDCVISGRESKAWRIHCDGGMMGAAVSGRLERRKEMNEYVKRVLYYHNKIRRCKSFYAKTKDLSIDNIKIKNGALRVFKKQTNLCNTFFTTAMENHLARYYGLMLRHNMKYVRCNDLKRIFAKSKCSGFDCRYQKSNLRIHSAQCIKYYEASTKNRLKYIKNKIGIKINKTIAKCMKLTKSIFRKRAFSRVDEITHCAKISSYFSKLVTIVNAYKCVNDEDCTDTKFDYSEVLGSLSTFEYKPKLPGITARLGISDSYNMKIVKLCDTLVTSPKALFKQLWKCKKQVTILDFTSSGVIIHRTKILKNMGLSLKHDDDLFSALLSFHPNSLPKRITLFSLNYLLRQSILVQNGSSLYSTYLSLMQNNKTIHKTITNFFDTQKTLIVKIAIKKSEGELDLAKILLKKLFNKVFDNTITIFSVHMPKLHTYIKNQQKQTLMLLSSSFRQITEQLNKEDKTIITSLTLKTLLNSQLLGIKLNFKKNKVVFEEKLGKLKIKYDNLIIAKLNTNNIDENDNLHASLLTSAGRSEFEKKLHTIRFKKDIKTIKILSISTLSKNEDLRLNLLTNKGKELFDTKRQTLRRTHDLKVIAKLSTKNISNHSTMRDVLLTFEGRTKYDIKFSSIVNRFVKNIVKNKRKLAFEYVKLRKAKQFKDPIRKKNYRLLASYNVIKEHITDSEFKQEVKKYLKKAWTKTKKGKLNCKYPFKYIETLKKMYCHRYNKKKERYIAKGKYYEWHDSEKENLKEKSFRNSGYFEGTRYIWDEDGALQAKITYTKRHVKRCWYERRGRHYRRYSRVKKCKFLYFHYANNIMINNEDIKFKATLRNFKHKQSPGYYSTQIKLSGDLKITAEYDGTKYNGTYQLSNYGSSRSWYFYNHNKWKVVTTNHIYKTLFKSNREIKKSILSGIFDVDEEYRISILRNSYSKSTIVCKQKSKVVSCPEELGETMVKIKSGLSKLKVNVKSEIVKHIYGSY
jgi:hypothetical protein